MSIVDEIREAWGWTGIDPQEIVVENDFGNLIIRDSSDRFWRLCPEDTYCVVVADSIEEYDSLMKDEEFLSDWFMASMVQEAKSALGHLATGQKYHMIIPGVLGGEYGGSNVKVAPLVEIVRFSGDLGKQIEDLPEGAQIELKVVP